jgi:hypothetical protein
MRASVTVFVASAYKRPRRLAFSTSGAGKIGVKRVDASFSRAQELYLREG